MYIGVDVGATKTLVAVFSADGDILEEAKFPTPKKYDDFLSELSATISTFKHHDFQSGAVALPGRIDRKRGRMIELANLSWKNESAEDDCRKILDCPVVIENDSNLAGLSEAIQQPDYEKVLYITISTGIGTGFVYKGVLEPSMLDIEGGQMLLPHKDKLMRWELFASGRAIAEHFGKRAAEIPASDETAWKHIVRNLVIGFFANIAIVEPDLIIIGGSIGTYFDRYGHLLQAELDKKALPVVKIPKIVQAKRPEEAVIYGCYEYAKQLHAHAKSPK